MWSNLALIGQEAAFQGVPYREGPAGHRPGPTGGTGARPSRRYVRAPDPTTPALAGLPGPLRWVWASPRATWLGTRYSHPITHPVYPTRYPP